MDSSIIQITSLDFYFWIKPLAILQNIISLFLTYHFEDRILYSQTSPKQPFWGPKKVAVVERWPLWGGGGVIWQFLLGENNMYIMPSSCLTFCNHGNPIINDHQRTIRIKFPDHSWLVCQSLKKLAFVERFFWQLGDAVQWLLLL